MKIALLHRMFALLLVAGLMLGPVAHAAFAGEHCAHVAAQETFGDRSSGEYDGARTSANPGDCETNSVPTVFPGRTRPHMFRTPRPKIGSRPWPPIGVTTNRESFRSITPIPRVVLLSLDLGAIL